MSGLPGAVSVRRPARPADPLDHRRMLLVCANGAAECGCTSIEIEEDVAGQREQGSEANDNKDPFCSSDEVLQHVRLPSDEVATGHHVAPLAQVSQANCLTDPQERASRRAAIVPLDPALVKRALAIAERVPHLSPAMEGTSMNRFEPGFPRWVGFRLTSYAFCGSKFKGSHGERRLPLVSPAALDMIGLAALA